MPHPRPIVLADEAQLCEYLDNLKAALLEPVAAGLGAKGRPFLVQRVSFNGETLYEVVRENPVYTKTDARIGKEGVCETCGAVKAREDISTLSYPISVLQHDIDVLIPEGGPGQPVVDQPPPPDEIEKFLAEEQETQ